MSSLFSARKDAVTRRVQDLQETFFRSLSSDVPNTPSAQASGKLPGGEPFIMKGSDKSSCFFLVNDVDLVCGGTIGTGGKFCVRSRAECTVVKHDKARFEGLEQGIYLKGANQDAYCNPCLSTTRLSPDAVDHIMEGDCADLNQARRLIDSVNNLDIKLVTKLDLEKIFDVKPPPRFTPLKKSSTNVDLRAKFDTVLEMLPEENPKEEGSGTKSEQLKNYLLELATMVEAYQVDFETVSEQLFEIASQIGVAPKGAPPTLWLGHMEAKSDIEDLSKSVKRKVDATDLPNITAWEGKVEALEQTHKRFKTDVKLSFDQVAAEFVNHSQNSNGNISQVVVDKLTEFQKRLNAMEVASGSLNQANTMFVKAGKFSFSSLEDVGAWADQYLPADCPFGAFVDAYSFLERVKSSKDVGDLYSAVGNMDTRRKANISADEAIVVEAFQYPLPRCFRGGGTGTNVGGAWLPGIRTKETWENKAGTRGVKIAIQDNMEGIRFRIDSLIMQRLIRFPEAASLAKQLLSDTVTFITSLLSFISTTYLQLTNAGYTDESAWNLVSKLVSRMFATDCYHDKRGIASELLDSDDHRSMAVGILWATFATHNIMQEYLKFGFADHPSVSGEYTRFLVANAGIAKISSAEKSIVKLQGLVTALEKKLEVADKKATTASSKADEAIRLSKKKPKRAGEEEA